MRQLYGEFKLLEFSIGFANNYFQITQMKSSIRIFLFVKFLMICHKIQIPNRVDLSSMMRPRFNNDIKRKN